MRQRRHPWVPLLAAVVIFASASLSATTVMQLNLAELVNRADRIVRGTILSATEGSVEVGGGRLPTVTYRVQVDEVFRGDVVTVKGVRIAEIRMIGKLGALQTGNIRRVSVLPEMPQLVVGQAYLLFATRPSAIGLSTTVGLGQGFFAISGRGKDEMAVNGANNSGLFRDMEAGAPSARAARTARTASAGAAREPGPIAYDELASQVRALLQGREERQ